MARGRYVAVAALITLLAGLQARAGDNGNVDAWALTGDPVPPDTPGGPDKSHYTLFDPVPEDQLRPFSTDRPGKTHSSLTVDAGHFQVESDFVNFTYDHYSPDAQTTRITSIATPILKAGITNWMDLELGLDFYNDTHVTSRSGSGSAPAAAAQGGSSSSGRTTVTSAPAGGATAFGAGFGDMLLGSKISIFGNDGGAQSLAVLPFVKIPTAAHNAGNGVTEYSLDIPYTIDLDTLWSITAEPEFALLKNSANTGHHGDYSFIVNVNRPVFWNNVTASLELASEFADRDVTPRYTVDPALQWLVFANFQLDMGVYIALNKAAPDYNPYVGVSYRY